VGVGEAVATAPERAADLDTAVPLLEFTVEAAVTMPVGAPAVEAATMIPPAAVAALGAIVVDAFSEGEACTLSVAWMTLKVSMPPQLAAAHPVQAMSHLSPAILAESEGTLLPQ